MPEALGVRRPADLRHCLKHAILRNLAPFVGAGRVDSWGGDRKGCAWGLGRIVPHERGACRVHSIKTLRHERPWGQAVRRENVHRCLGTDVAILSEVKGPAGGWRCLACGATLVTTWPVAKPALAATP